MTDYHSSNCFAIVGPTGVGKTACAILLAERLDIEVISVDSRQVYRYMDIGTAKPDRHERSLVAHHLIDIVDPDETYSAGQFSRDSRKAAAAITGSGRIPVLVGGTGLYLRALTDGLVNGPPSDPGLRADLNREISTRGLRSLHRDLQEIDPEAASVIHPNDQARVVRALEINRLTGLKFSDLKQQPRSRPFKATIFGLRMERGILYKRIDSRVDRMIESGFVDEVSSLLSMGYHRSLRSLQGIGYRQLSGFLQGDLQFSEAVDSTKKETRNLAKRQMTWFGKTENIRWLNIPSSGSLKEAVGTIIGTISTSPATSPGKRKPR